ncbi:MAG TPA: YceI family protein, partial [Longimicrobiales bacterium]|nr:YceI family protein [Longimicrobiales bacterium]
MSKTTWTIDPVHTQVGFSVKHMMFTKVHGEFTELSGAIEVDPDKPGEASVEVQIDAASIDTGVEDRDEHLRSSDFLDVENHPTITFESRRIEGEPSEPGDAFKVVGDLTIRGTTEEVVLDARYEGRGEDPWGGTRAGFSAEVTIDRRDFGLTWNQALETG